MESDTISYQGPRCRVAPKIKTPRQNAKKNSISPIKNTNVTIPKITAGEIQKILHAILFNREFINMPHNKLKKLYARKYASFLSLTTNSQSDQNEKSDKLFNLQTFSERKYIDQIKKLSNYFTILDKEIKAQVTKSINCLNLLNDQPAITVNKNRPLKILIAFGNSRFTIKETFILMVKNNSKVESETTSKSKQFQQDFKVTTDLVNFFMKLPLANKNSSKKCYTFCTFKNEIPFKISKIQVTDRRNPKIFIIGINNDEMNSIYEVGIELINNLNFDQSLPCLELDIVKKCPVLKGHKNNGGSQNVLRKVNIID